MFEMCAGRPPYEGDRATVLRLQVEGDPPELSSLVELEPWFDELVGELLAKDPKARPGTHQVNQRIEVGLERVLALPELWPLDAEGAVRRPEPFAEASFPIARVAGVVAELVLGVCALLVVIVASIATLVLLLTLPS